MCLLCEGVAHLTTAAAPTAAPDTPSAWPMLIGMGIVCSFVLFFIAAALFTGFVLS
jgi:hypothetical protein